MTQKKNLILVSLLVPFVVLALDPSEQPPSYEAAMAMSQNTNLSVSPKSSAAAQQPQVLARAPSGPVRGRDPRTNIEKCMRLRFRENGGPVCALTLSGGSQAACFAFWDKRFEESENPVLMGLFVAQPFILCTGATCFALGACMGNCSNVIEQFGSDAALATPVRVAGHLEPAQKQIATIAHYHADQCAGCTCRAYAGCLEGITDVSRKPLRASARLITRLLDLVRPAQDHQD